MVQISQQLAVSVYAEWDEHYRTRITTATGAAKPIQLPVFGDLRHFRNDIVHHRGIASEDNSGRSEVLSHWFAPGDILYFDTPKVAEFMARLELAWAQPTEGWTDPQRISTSATTIRLPGPEADEAPAVDGE
jgi:hypothetical protein